MFSSRTSRPGGEMSPEMPRIMTRMYERKLGRTLVSSDVLKFAPSSESNDNRIRMN
jgi:hypothetical protein